MIIDTIGGDMFTHSKIGWTHEITVEIIMTWHKMNIPHVGYLIKIIATQALAGQNGYKKALVKPQRYGWMINVNQGVHSVGSG
jgi:hypothetical protein